MEWKMRRPGSITASIVVMLIVCLFIVLIFLAVTSGQKKQDTMITLAVGAMFLVPVVAALVDVVFLFIRRRWVYYYNLVLFLIASLFMIRFGLFMDLQKESGMFAVAMRVTGAVFSALLVWLCVELILRRRRLLEYLSMKGPDIG
jgi:hypothetical protein